MSRVDSSGLPDAQRRNRFVTDRWLLHHCGIAPSLPRFMDSL